MRVINCEQGSNEWFAARLGIPSASVFNVICTTKGEASKGATREKLLNTLVAEHISGERMETYTNAAMERGTILEDEAADLFAFHMDAQLEKVGFCLHDSGVFGGSPDRLLVGDVVNWNYEIGLEIKCPLPHTHVEYLTRNKLPTAYIQQVQGSMLVTGYPEWYFMSYCPKLPPLIIKVERDDEFCTKLQSQLLAFIKEINDKIELIKGL